jgi:hypothetical protein
MLDEAYKEGNRFRQDHIRKLIERLEQLKARTLDKTVRILEPQQQDGRNFHRHRRRGGRRHHHGGYGGGGAPAQGGAPQGQPYGAPKTTPPAPPQPPAQG